MQASYKPYTYKPATGPQSTQQQLCLDAVFIFYFSFDSLCFVILYLFVLFFYKKKLLRHGPKKLIPIYLPHLHHLCPFSRRIFCIFICLFCFSIKRSCSGRRAGVLFAQRHSPEQKDIDVGSS